MGRRPCPGCARELPFAARRCRHCGWRRGAGAGDGSARRARLLRRVAVAGVLLALAAFGASRIDPVALADWYADLALRYLPAGFAAPPPVEAPSEAFRR